ncbi:hypothetical protein [Paraburkholderia sp. J41]|uniref:hypothetical protein n=1 Tax=Paraburkholderia sp. J41 TaxID=2805433 RepID=UPI002AC35F69|nr:hypothetical protein [Paraburkholderia sp. J41]
MQAAETRGVSERRAGKRREEGDRRGIQAAIEKGGATVFRFSIHGGHDGLNGEEGGTRRAARPVSSRRKARQCKPQ